MTNAELAEMIATTVQKALDEKNLWKTKESQRHERSKEKSVSNKSSPHLGEKSHQNSKEDTIADELKGLRDKIKKLENQTRSLIVRDSKNVGCPFSTSIVKDPLPAHYKYAKITNYDGREEPDEHLSHFENMVMYGDQIKCKIFLTTLVDTAQRWFEKLEPGSILSFKDLHLHFVPFSSSKRNKKTAFSLFEVKQGTK